MKRFALVVALLALSCAENKGEPCRADGDCDGALICAAQAACPSDDCVGICAQVCEGPSDCEEEEMCRSEIGANRFYCVFDQLAERE